MQNLAKEFHTPIKRMEQTLHLRLKMKKKFLLLIVFVICLLAGTAYAAKQKANTHSYYKGLTKVQAEEADKIARSIAEKIKADKSLNTDLKKVRTATRTVALYCSRGIYGNDEKRYYRSPYGVFVAGVFTCAGATRALGRVLDFMGYNWRHVNENQWAHQWCVLEMDGQIGFADGQVGMAGYGEHY